MYMVDGMASYLLHVPLMKLCRLYARCTIVVFRPRFRPFLAWSLVPSGPLMSQNCGTPSQSSFRNGQFTDATTAFCLQRASALKSALLVFRTQAHPSGFDIVLRVSCSRPRRHGLGSASRGMAKSSGRCWSRGRYMPMVRSASGVSLRCVARGDRATRTWFDNQLASIRHNNIIQMSPIIVSR